MKYHTNKEFELINLHDSKIDKIEYDNRNINLFLTSANLYADHSANINKEATCIKPCALIFHGIISADAKVFNEQKREFENHPEPDEPLDNEIIEVSVINKTTDVTCYIIKGFHNAGCSEWEICCEGFELQWEEFNGDAWWVNWPPK